MIEPARLHGKRLAMIAVGERPDGSDDVAVFSGVAHWDGDRLTLRRGTEESSIAVERGWLARIREVPPELRAVAPEAEYCFTVSAEDAPELDDGDRLA